MAYEFDEIEADFISAYSYTNPENNEKETRILLRCKDGNTLKASSEGEMGEHFLTMKAGTKLSIIGEIIQFPYTNNCGKTALDITLLIFEVNEK